MPELGDVRQYVRTLPTNTLMGFGAFAALTTYWYATRPKALKPPCDLAMQSVEVEAEVRAVLLFLKCLPFKAGIAEYFTKYMGLMAWFFIENLQTVLLVRAKSKNKSKIHVMYFY